MTTPNEMTPHEKLFSMIPQNLLRRLDSFLKSGSTGEVSFDIHEGRVKKIRIVETESAERPKKSDLEKPTHRS